MMHENAGSGGMEILNKQSFSSLKLEFPSLCEQNKIACFFENIDNEIDNANDILHKLIETKKALLQRLFI
jgi:restriction endonuclease S subunit